MLQWLQNLTNRLITAESPASPFPEIRSTTDFDQLLSHETPIILFKHSPTCPVSLAAHREMQAFAATRPDVPVVVLSVLNHRTLSRVIAEQVSVPHESPQAIVFQHGIVLGYLSHDDVTVEELTSLLPSFTAASHDAPVHANSVRSPQP